MYALLQRCCIVQLIGPLTVIFSGGMLCVFHPVIFHMKTLTGHISNLIFVQLQFSGGISAFVDAANLSILNRTEIIGERYEGLDPPSAHPPMVGHHLI